MSCHLFGWDLLYASVENDVKNNQDILVCFTHLVLISNGFKCIGLGESKNIDGSETQTESLPKGWNDDYAIRYVYQGRLYLLKATNLDDGIMINIIRVDERTTALLQLNSRAVAQRTGTLNDMIPDNKNMIDQIKTQLIDKVVTSTKSRECSTQTDSSLPRRTLAGSIAGFRDDIPLGSRYPGPAGPGIDRRPGPDPRDYGRSDLDPFPGIMDPLRVPNRILPPGGMLFQPPFGPQPGGSNLGVPPGAIPPGARFDPFRPPDGSDLPTPRRPPHRPDNDEFPPPGYDDMFM